MKNFADYSKYYDTIYEEKDYKRESGFIVEFFDKSKSNGLKTLLSLGCGTCSYELLLAKKGYRIVGIDRSKQMLKLACQKIKAAGLESKIKVFAKDVRKFVFKEKFDNAMAMFNIVGYQTKNEDLEKMFKNVYHSLKKGGIFVFDCWYMPAVLKDKPTDRIRKIKTHVGNIIRLTKSALNLNKDIIEISFDVIETVKDRVVNETNETHFMRYWSLPELQYFLGKAGFSVIRTCNFMDPNSEISDDEWNIFVVARKDK